ncbi:MAG: hypothetical protein RLZZ579_40 [Actinomycetota bacterium]|jgi:predicted amidohydrolase YtcJ
MSLIFPAFRDGHAHPLFAGRESLGPQVDGLKSINDVLDVVESFAKNNPHEDWIVGGAYDRSLARTFEAKWLDKACADRPVILHASDHHTIWVNSKALELAGLTDVAPQVSTGSCDLGQDGKPNGTLRESGAMDLVLNLVPALSMDQEIRAWEWAQDRLLENGIVEVQDAWIERGMTEIYLEALKRDKLRVKVNLAARVTPETYESDFDYFESCREQVTSAESRLLCFKTAKFFADGVLGSGTAAVIEPYSHNNSHGEPVWRDDLLVKAAKLYAANDFQLHIHAIGDQAVRTALNVIEQSPKTSLPAVIAHAELIHTSDIPRFGKSGVIANMQPLWARPDGMLLSCEANLGRARLDQLYRMRDLIDSGATIAFGSDWPVTSVNPLEGIKTAVTRTYLDSEPWTPSQAISVAEAVSAYTVNVAKQLGSSDLNEQVVLSEDPRMVRPQAIGDIRVLRVIRDGSTIWEA